MLGGVRLWPFSTMVLKRKGHFEHASGKMAFRYALADVLLIIPGNSPIGAG
jgi:hypothetical protein